MRIMVFEPLINKGWKIKENSGKQKLNKYF